MKTAVAAALWVALHQGLAAAEPHNAEVAAVRALYVRFAAEAVIDDVGPSGLADAPQSVLRQHFTDELVRLWLRDRDCVRRTRAICRLDFLPLWDSQDPTGTVVKLRWDASTSRVVAGLWTGDGPPRLLSYSLVQIDGAWRIADIDFGPGRRSLRQLLGVERL